MKRAVLISGLTALALAGTAVVGVAASHGKAGMGGLMGGFMGERGAMMSFEDVDANADGKITADEMKAHADARFAEADADKDGFLNAEELQAHMLAQATARMQERSARMIEMMDTDSDGKISAAEMQAGPRRGDRFERMLSRMDQDEDGAISRAEMDEARERWSEHRDGYGKGHGMGMGMHRNRD
ncbi:MAG: EF-hand domain-containing protein [Rhodobacterales bacterium]|nr:EF-hand domain-containing protein [Rhodobacterales bacterium]MDX5414500.1 EF-hand domain-containing protein [Rhodobacterales bacterium]